MAEDDVITDAPAPAPALASDVPDAPDGRPRYKSWRKKYRKMKTRFDDVMKTNSNMYKEEQKLEALAKRLQEQNDELLDLLLDLNSSLDLPGTLRFNINWKQEWPEKEGIDSTDKANRMLYELHEMERQGRVTHAEVAQTRLQLESHAASLGCTPLSQLEKEIPHTVLLDRSASDQNAPNDLVADPLAYLTSQHEAHHLDAFDLTWGGSGDSRHGLLSSAREKSPPKYSQMTAREVEREVELHNPLSVHNWLKKHNINIAADSGGGGGDDTRSDTGTPATAGKKGGHGGGGGPGRNLAKKVGDKAVERARERDDGSPMSSSRTDVLDAGPDANEETADDHNTPSGSARSSRKSRDASDDTYRPKGGRSGGGRSSKRKRDEAADVVKGAAISKKPRTSVGGVGAGGGDA